MKIPDFWGGVPPRGGTCHVAFAAVNLACSAPGKAQHSASRNTSETARKVPCWVFLQTREI